MSSITSNSFRVQITSNAFFPWKIVWSHFILGNLDVSFDKGTINFYFYYNIYNNLNIIYNYDNANT